MTYAKFLPAAALLALLLLSVPAHAQVTVTDPWVRATVPAQMGTGAFMTLRAATDATLVAAESPLAGVVEIHEMAMRDNVMRMRAVDALALPAGRDVQLKPGGYHVMLLDLKGELKAGDSVPITLVIEQGGVRKPVEVKAVVRALGPGMGGPQGHMKK